MLARLLAVWDNLRTSLWALPLTIACACAGFAILALALDLPWASSIAWLYSGSAAQAPEFAASLVGALITLTALAFSITMIVLTLAAQQLGPRLIEIFMSDRGTQAALGLFLGTVVYLLLVLRALDGRPGGEAPSLAITGGTVLVLASMVVLLLFVHSLAKSIVSDHVIERVGRSLDRAIARGFPETAAKGPPQPRLVKRPVRIKSAGYVQRIDYSAIVDAASRYNSSVVLDFHAGQHLLPGEELAWRLGDGDLTEVVNKAVVVSSQRTFGQDPEWSVRQLVEIALRALSPGINDEFTAITVIERLSVSLARLMVRHDHPGCWCDREGVARVFATMPTFASLLGASFDQVRAAAQDHAQVLLAIAVALHKLTALAQAPHQAPLASQLDRLNEASTSAPAWDGAKITAEIRAARVMLAQVSNAPQPENAR